MISSVFGKTKPINYVLVLSFLFALYWFVNAIRFGQPIDVDNLPGHLLRAACLLFTVLIINFVVQRNQLTGTHSYSLYIYSLFFLIFPDILLDGDSIYASLFLLLAMRRLISLKSLRNSKFKIFDGALWIVTASLFIDWALLFLVLVWLFVYFYEPENFRNWLIPLAAVIVVGIISWSFSIIVGNPDYLSEHYRFLWDGLLSYWRDWGNSFKLGLFLLLVLLSGLVSFLKLGKSGHGKIISMRLIALALIIAFAVVLLMSNERGGAVILLFFPAAVFISKYIETLKKEAVKEAMLTGLLLVGILVFAGEWVAK
ncbi:DUF6427 family protein [Robiginitalea sp. IMCC44478]|uniref:DUF6427 family protein n=1 Tax=Robiginitalea sp. IMCC44478 TaxID=3459122 RepID=UPI0040417B80